MLGRPLISECSQSGSPEMGADGCAQDPEYLSLPFVIVEACRW